MNTPPTSRYRTLAALLLAALPALAPAQEPAAVRKVTLPNFDSQVAAKLIALDRRLNATHSPNLAAGLVGQLSGSPLDVFTSILADARNREIWDLLAEEYHATLQESGDALVTLADAPPHLGIGWSSGQVRRLCHQRLAALPRSSLEIYRRRVDAEARALFEKGMRTGSPVPLRRLVDELFCSSSCDQALDLLGDLAFEKGDFDEARHWWRLLAPAGGRRDEQLTFPRSQVDLARTEAKQVLALIFQGRHNEAREELARFVLRHPNAKGALAGQDDRYAAILNRTLQTFQKESIRNNDEPWTTFGGSASRHRTLTSALSHALWEDGPAWRVPLPDLGKASRLAFHPVIVHNQVLIADHRSLVSYHLATGKIAFRYVHDDILKEIGTGVTSPRFTLSADGERAYVRLGRPGIGPGRSTPSYLVCIDLTQSGVARSGSERELWHVRANGADKAPAFFEGAPLVHGGRVYIALSRVVGRRVVTSIVCYDTQGRQRWTREVCDCPEFEDNGNGPRYRQHLLTLAGGQIVYCSHAGAIVAVDAWTGQPTWAVRYPSRGPHTAENGPSPRDLTPALYADGCVFAAPLDCDRVFCIDAVTGQIQWETEGVEVVHLLGVAQGRLIAATNQGLISIRTATGQTEWSQPSDGRLPSAGRGLLAGDWLIWPTQDAKLPYRLVTLRSGQPPSFDPSSLHTVPVGNLAFGQGCLAIAGVSELVVYVPAHKINELPPGGGRPHARLGQKYFPIFRQ